MRAARRLAGDDLVATDAHRHPAGGVLPAIDPPLLVRVVEDHLAWPDADAVAVLEACGLADGDAVHAGAVSTAQVDGLDEALPSPKHRVRSRDEVVIDGDGARCIPSDGGVV